MISPWSSSRGRDDPNLTTTAGARVSRSTGIRMPRTVPTVHPGVAGKLADDELGELAAAPGLEPGHREVAGLDQGIIGDDQADEDVGAVVVRRHGLGAPVPVDQVDHGCRLAERHGEADEQGVQADLPDVLSADLSSFSMPRVMRIWDELANDRRRCSRSRTAVTGADPPRPSSRTSASTVSGPHTSSVTRPALRWNSPTAPWVIGPRMPSTRPASNPSAPRRSWSSLTSFATHHRRAETEQPVSQAELGLDQHRPGRHVAVTVVLETRSRSGTPEPPSGSRRRTSRADRR